MLDFVYSVFFSVDSSLKQDEQHVHVGLLKYFEDSTCVSFALTLVAGFSAIGIHKTKQPRWQLLKAGLNNAKVRHLFGPLDLPIPDDK